RRVGMGENEFLVPGEQGRDPFILFGIGPVRGENVVGPASEQQVEGRGEQLVDLFPDLLFEQGGKPPAMREVALIVLFRPARGLHDSVERQEDAACDLAWHEYGFLR